MNAPVPPSFGGKHELVLQLDGFAHAALLIESENLGVSTSELAAFAILYYLADADSGRPARNMPALPLPSGADPNAGG